MTWPLGDDADDGAARHRVALGKPSALISLGFYNHDEQKEQAANNHASKGQNRQGPVRHLDEDEPAAQH
jgi:hypothetical protein